MTFIAITEKTSTGRGKPELERKSGKSMEGKRWQDIWHKDLNTQK